MSCVGTQRLAYLNLPAGNRTHFQNLMHTSLSHSRPSRTSRWIVGAALLTTLALVACGPSDVGASKLKAIPKGAPRATILAAMGTGPLAPTKAADEPRIVNGFRHQRYITNGGQSYELFWYREEPGTVEDPILKNRETPIVVVGDTLVGWGWKFFTPYAKQERLPDPSQDQARLDSIAKAHEPVKK